MRSSLARVMLLTGWIATLALTTSPARAQSADQKDANIALGEVVEFYRTQVGYEGAYVWRYSADLSKREGEGVANRGTGWTQPPGTTSVGEAYLQAWRLCGNSDCLDAAREAAHALVRTQLQSGGWDSRFELEQEHRRRYAYRVDEKPGSRNYSTFDDNKSQSCLMLLMHVDEALEFRDEQIHEAVEYAITHMLAAQYPNGAWPQQFTGPPDAARYPVKQASYPQTWSREHPDQDYRGYYTLNDSNMSWIIDMLLEAHRIYQREDCMAAAQKTGDFFLLAQMPDPQPGWAQQYDLNMHPAWARRFEPPAITGGESQSVMRTLLSLYRHTGHQRFISTIPKAIDYYRASLLPDGRLARFYELRTNAPLYFTKDYQLTDSDDDLPTHYGFKVSSRLDSIEKEYRKLLSTNADELLPAYRHVRPVRMSAGLEKRAMAIVDALDDRGAWVEDGVLKYHGDDDNTRRIIDSQTFTRNLTALAEFVGATE